MSYFFVKVNIPKNEQRPGRLPWMPTMIVFESDGELKGIGMFTSWLKASDFASMISGMFTAEFTTEVIQLGEAGMPLTEFTEGVINATRNMQKAMVDTPIYVDPPDPFCKGVDPAYNNLQRFMRRAMRDELEAMCEHLSFDEYRGFTVALHKRKVDGYFGCTCFRGKFENAESMNTAMEDARGTTLEKFCISTEFFPLQDTALLYAHTAVDEFTGPQREKKIIV